MDNRRVIVALDFPSADEALACAARLDPRLCRVKVGKELFVATGPALIGKLQERGFEVFLDLKFHDIPNTVAGACKAAAALGVWMVNVHASGGEAMMRAARDAVASVTKPPLLIAVTILTSLDDDSLRQVGFADGVRGRVEGLSRLARECGLDGVVCSAQEAPWVRASAGTTFTLVTPGIRLEGDAKADQARVVTPPEALRLGADYLVIGRSVTRSEDPVATLEAIHRSLEEESRRK
ncbi:orotidine-5'-phosphate decarboxylase [Usitatibacter palustris]|uniref:Orotidine 5'-phosphate decarboxylase n=1 Tax=Usitatibacter palustris TaxID=2732487 RepID=A0A6M4H7G3_9PROT|nr:orotidine-5'-phosphate decarboxylase [Usitatibacter palustris]QJR15536.1 Orotidine 5'-phosphate decarboxylase [Usitatibacter palustris]